MTSSRALAADAFHALVRQFSHELCFYRELIQNAVDAGSRRVDIWLDYEDGLALINVRDTGEGMNAKVIDSQFVRLFASAKSGDLSKIGRFGVGFVSVFAVQPEAVIVDTGREGQSWRLHFNKNGEFERMVRAQVQTGTHIQLQVRMRETQFSTFVSRSKESIAHWCRFVPVELNFQHTPMQRPFAADGVCPIRFESGGTTVAAAIAADGQTHYGFYKGGITLMEGTDLSTLPPLKDPSLAGIAFCIDSRPIEYTLSRDTIKVDANFTKAVTLLKQAVSQHLIPAMYQRLEALADGDPTEYRDMMATCQTHVLRTITESGKSARFMPVLNGHALSPSALKAHQAHHAKALRALAAPNAERILLFAEEESPVSVALGSRHSPVLRCRSGDALHSWLATQGFDLVAAEDRLTVLEVLPDSQVPAAARQLAGQTQRALERCGLRLRNVLLARWDDREQLCWWATADPGSGQERLVYRDQAGDRASHLLLNLQHPMLDRLLRIPQATAAMLLARAISVECRAPVESAQLCEVCSG